jgi:hypothetical protein
MVAGQGAYCTFEMGFAASATNLKRILGDFTG